ncbi:MAG: hypothetical protein MUE78_13300, partial [Ilumatobacteraceae bacterium]|nr:hypothetical protein [Ilumatobacteraceae bacterium]
ARDLANTPPAHLTARRIADMAVTIGAETGLAVATTGAVPRQLGMNRAALTAAGFTGAASQTLVVHRSEGPTIVAVGVGDPASLTPAVLRDAAAAFVRAAGSRARLATNLTDLDGVSAQAAGQAVTEGVLLAAYKYGGLKTASNGTPAERSVTLLASAERRNGVAAGAERSPATSPTRRPRTSPHGASPTWR